VLSPEVIVAAKSYQVKLSKIAKDIDDAANKLRKLRKHLSKKDRKRLDLNVKQLTQARALVSSGCHGGRSMTAQFSGPTV
jgi:hypothetical protein